MSAHRIVAHRTKSGVVVADGAHDKYYTGSRYSWRVLLKYRTELPLDYD